MRVSVTGLCLEVKETEKEGKKHRTAMLFQPGEKDLTQVRLQEGSDPSQGEQVTFIGRLMSWKSRDGVGTMIMAE